MKVFFIDDSNIAIDRKLEFFIYGGLIVDEKNIFELVKFLYNLKQREKIKQERPIKWENINWRKEGSLKPEKFKKIKEEILRFVGQSSCEIIIYLAPHDFYSKINVKKWPKIEFTVNQEKQIKALRFALNICLQKFNSYLEENKSLGLIFADEFGGKKVKKELGQYCFRLCPEGTKFSNLEQIVYPIINIDSEYSAIHQINDVVLGAIQHSLKELTKNFIPVIKKNFWKKNKEIIGNGINIYPKNPKTQKIERKLNILKEKFKRLVNE